VTRHMDVLKAIGELRAEKARLDAAIARLERMKREDQGKPRVWDGESRRAAADRMRKYWADRKAALAKANGKAG
jgi:hypothetical protein